MIHPIDNLEVWPEETEFGSEQLPLPGTELTPEPLLAKYLQIINNAMAVIKPETPKDLIEELLEAAEAKGYSEFNWPGQGLRFLYHQTAAKALSMSDDNYVLTLDRSKLKVAEIEKLIAELADFYIPDGDLDAILSNNKNQFIVLHQKGEA